MHARMRGLKSLLALYQIINKTWNPFLSKWNSWTTPDMNIKVAAFTVSEKSSKKAAERKFIPQMSIIGIFV